METFEAITNKEIVGNLTPDDLMVHARHMFLSTAKDLCNSQEEGERAFGDMCLETAIKLQGALDIWNI